MSKKFLCTLLLLTLAGAAAGCGFFKAAPPKLTGTGMDMFGPQGMRLHPLSRVVLAPAAPATAPTTAPGAPAAPPVPGSALLEARMELTDQFGDTGKGVGVLTLDLYAYSLLAFDRRGNRLGQWTFDLTSPVSNGRQWDAITRTYVFKVPLPRASLMDARQAVLAAQFALPNGGTLTDQRVLEVK